jgi:putative transposase
LVLPDVALHLVQRGVDRQPCFLSDADYPGYLGLLALYSRKYGCSIHAYCLMTNHVHLLLTPHHPGACARVMKAVNQRYVQRLNASVGRSGTLWEGRFHSSIVSSSRYALTCYRYIELNPVRAGMVSDPCEYPWSSHLSNAGALPHPMLSAHVAYESLGDAPEHRGSAYRALFDVELPRSDIEEIRKATRGGYCVGEPRRPRGRPPRNQSTHPSV